MKIEDMRHIAAKRTAGEWDWSDSDFSCPSKGFTCDCGIATEDAEFIALSANVFDKLLDVAEAAREHFDINSKLGCYESTDKVRSALAALEANNG